MNLETGLQEAKILDEEEASSQAVELVENDPEGEQLITVEGETVHDEDDLEDSIIRQHVKAAAPVSDHSELTTSLALLQNHKTVSTGDLTKALESLADLGHELDFGVTIVKPENLEILLSIVQDSKVSPAVREIAVRVIGASLRNNPDAIQSTIGSKVAETLLKSLDSVVSSSSLSSDQQMNKLAGRLVYALGSVINSGEGDSDVYGEADGEYAAISGGAILRRVFTSGGPDVKRKCTVFVSDRVLSSNWHITELREWSTVFQQALTAGTLDDSTKTLVFEAIIKMHEFIPDSKASGEQQVLRRRNHQAAEEELPVEDDFLNWLAGQASSKNADKEFLTEVKRVRHEVFGNPLARRKDFDDL